MGNRALGPRDYLLFGGKEMGVWCVDSMCPGLGMGGVVRPMMVWVEVEKRVGAEHDG